MAGLSSIALRTMIAFGEVADKQYHPLAVGVCDCHPGSGSDHVVALGPATVYDRESPQDVGLCVADCPACAPTDQPFPAQGWLV